MSEWKERAVYTPVPAPSAGRGETDDRVASDKGAAVANKMVPGEGAAAFGETLPGEEAIASDPSAAVIGADAEDATNPRPTSDATALVRAENEDDDGYDPYSDWHDQGSIGALFEPDPWD